MGQLTLRQLIQELQRYEYEHGESRVTFDGESYAVCGVEVIQSRHDGQPVVDIR